MAAIALCYLRATDLGVAICAKQVSPVVMDAVLARIEHLNPRLNAYGTVTAAAAHAATQKAKASVMRGDSLGMLHGIPMSIKHPVATQGVCITHGSKLYEQSTPDDDAPIVERLERTGAIILGKTHAPECGHRWGWSRPPRRSAASRHSCTRTRRTRTVRDAART